MLPSHIEPAHPVQTWLHSRADNTAGPPFFFGSHLTKLLGPGGNLQDDAGRILTDWQAARGIKLTSTVGRVAHMDPIMVFSGITASTTCWPAVFKNTQGWLAIHGKRYVGPPSRRSVLPVQRLSHCEL